MGWTTACIFINEGSTGYLGNFPIHSPNKAKVLLVEDLGIQYGRPRLANFDAGIRPPSGWFCIGAYDRALILSGYEKLYGLAENRGSPFLDSLRQLFPNADILFFELTASTGYFAFEVYSRGQFERKVVGDPERGIVINEGTLTHEERKLGIDINAIDVRRGEAIVFGLTARFLSVPFDQFPGEKLSVELIKQRSSLFRYFLSSSK